MPEIHVFDASGRPQSLDWAKAKYGPFVIIPAAPATPALTMAWKLVALREKNDSAYVTRATGTDGQPVPGVRCCFYWPDAPTLAEAGPLGYPYEGITPDRAVSGYSNATGEVGFGMGGGAHYNPEIGERGPHAAWMHGAQARSDIFLGIGMIYDDHLHLNAEWQLLVDEDPQPGDEDLVALLRDMAANLHAIADIVESYADA